MTDKLELKSSHEVIYTVNVADVESIFYCKPTDPDVLTVLMKDGKRLYCDEVCPVQEEPVSEELEEAAKTYSNNLDSIYGSIGEQTRNAFKAGAQWQKQKYEANLACHKVYKKGKEAGMRYMKQLMMKDAVNAVISTNIDGYVNVQTGLVLPKEVGNVKFGDNVKLIIVKEE